MTLRGLVVLGLAVTMVGCQGELPVNVPVVSSGQLSDEDQIATMLNDVRDGLQTRRIYKVLAHVSRNYTDPQGRDYDALQRFLVDIFKNYREIRITRVPPRVIVQDGRARVIETFGTRAEPIKPQVNPPINLQGQVNIYLEKVDGEWMITEWSRVQ